MEKLFKTGKIMMRTVVVVGNAVSNSSILEKLASKFDVLKISKDELRKVLTLNDKIFALWIHFDTYLSDDYLSRLRQISVLATTTTGLTHISGNIKNFFGDNLICLNNDEKFLEKITTTAELTWMFVMLGNNSIQTAFESTSQGKWERQENLRMNQLSALSIGIVGYGRIGRMVSGYAKSFGMRVFTYDINASAVSSAMQNDIEIVASIQELIAKCDIISIHANVNLDSKILFTQELLNSIYKKLVLINTARAKFVDEDAIVEVIRTKPFLTYFTDVLKFEEENSSISESHLWKLSLRTDRVKITPHIGGANIEAMLLCEQNILDRIFLKSTSPKDYF